MSERDVCRAALETWGPEAQTTMLFEEMGELMQAVGKFRRAGTEDRAERAADVAEEIADVKIMLCQMEILFGVEDAVECYRAAKIARLEKRLAAARGEGQE